MYSNSMLYAGIGDDSNREPSQSSIQHARRNIGRRSYSSSVLVVFEISEEQWNLWKLCITCCGRCRAHTKPSWQRWRQWTRTGPFVANGGKQNGVRDVFGKWTVRWESIDRSFVDVRRETNGTERQWIEKRIISAKIEGGSIRRKLAGNKLRLLPNEMKKTEQRKYEIRHYCYCSFFHSK